MSSSLVPLSQDLILQFNNRDKNATKEIHNRYKKLLFYFVRKLKLVTDEEEMKDIVYEAFARLINGPQNFTVEGEIKGFLYETIVNLCIDHRRKTVSKSNHDKELVHLGDEYENSTHANLIKAEALLHIYEQVEALPEKCKIIFKLVHFGHLSNPEIARQLNITESTVRNQVARAIMLIKSGLDKKGRLGLVAWYSFSLYFLQKS